MQANVIEALDAIRNKPVFATTYERILLMQEISGKFDNAVQPVRFGLSLREFLRKISIPVKEYDLFPGRIVDKQLNEEEEQNYQQFIRGKNNPYHKVFLVSGHRGYDWENIINKGLIGIRHEVNEKIVRASTEDKRLFLIGIDLVLDSVTEFITRYADEAKKNGMDYTATALYNIAKDKPRTFYEGLLVCWMVSFIDMSYITHNPTLMIGRLDKILYPLYERDVEEGRLTREQTKLLITDFYCKHNLNMGRGEHQRGDANNSTTFERILNFDAPQYLEIGGTDEQGLPVHNELTDLFVECITPGFKNPVVMLRYYKGLDKAQPKFWRTLCEKTLQSCSIIIYNDDDTISAYTKLGISLEEARQYEHFGCNWCHLGINSFATFMGPSARSFCKHLGEDVYVPAIRNLQEFEKNTEKGPHKVIGLIENLIEEGKEPKSIDELYSAIYDKYYGEFCQLLRLVDETITVRCISPSSALTYGDCFNRYVIDNATCSGANGVKYHPRIQGFTGFATTIDMLIAIDKIVYTDKMLTLKQFHEIVKNDFKGNEKILALCKKADKFGSDTPLSNKHSVRFANMFADAIANANRAVSSKNNVMIFPSFESDTTHIPRGEMCCATYDGRREGEAFSQNANPSVGACKNGMVAMLNALSKLPFDRFVSGALNVDVQPNDYVGEKGIDNFASILTTYFNNGGLTAQISAVSVDSLKDAQENPQNHGDLLVRVTGYSGVFVDITKKLQDDIIRRMEN